MSFDVVTDWFDLYLVINIKWDEIHLSHYSPVIKWLSAGQYDNAVCFLSVNLWEKLVTVLLYSDKYIVIVFHRADDSKPRPSPAAKRIEYITTPRGTMRPWLSSSVIVGVVKTSSIIIGSSSWKLVQLGLSRRGTACPSLLFGSIGSRTSSTWSW